MGMRAGMFMRQGCRKKTNKRLYFGSYQNKGRAKKRRKIICGKKKGKDDKSQAKEGVTYAPGGGFD